MEDKHALKTLLAEARKDAIRLRNQLGEAEAAVRYLERVLGIRQTIQIQEVPFVIESHPADIRKLSAPQAAEAVLKEYGKPLHLSHIIERMYARGWAVQLDKRTLYNNLYGTMTRRKKDVFKRVRPSVFGLVEWDSQLEMET